MEYRYDIWTWDTMSEVDREWFEVCDELIAEKGEALSNSNGTNDIQFAAEKITLQDPNAGIGGYESILFECSGGSVQIGFDLKYAIVNAIAEEIVYGRMGSNLADLIKQKAMEAVREKLA